MSQAGAFIKLDQFLKWQGVVETGGQARQLVQAGRVRVNGQIETRRGRKLVSGDAVTIGNQTFTVDATRNS